MNAAKVSLLWKDDRSELVSTEVRAEDNTFQFEYVPDGEYILAVTDAKDVLRTEVQNCRGCFPPSHTEIKTLRSFGGAEQPLAVHVDLQTVVAPVPPAQTAAATE